MATESCYGIVLAGGLSRRMGGGDKGLQTIGGHSLIARVIAAIQSQCSGLVLSVNGDATRFQSFSLPIVADDVPGFKGPLAGLLAGLDWIAENHPFAAYALSVPSDTPFLPDDLIARLTLAREAESAEIACAASGGRMHPVVALWPVRIRTDLRSALVGEDQRKIERFMQDYRCARADWPSEPYDPFFNVNAPADLAKAEALLFARDKTITSA